MCCSRVRVGLSDVMDDPMWDSNGFVNYNDPAAPPKPSGKDYAMTLAALEHGFYKPKVYAKVVKKAKAIMSAVSTARKQMFTAFRGWSEFDQFVSALYTSVKNSLELYAEVFALMTISTMIGRAKALGHEIPLVTNYNQLTGREVPTGEAALQDEAFCRYMLMAILNTRDNMRRMSIAYNNGESPTFTPPSDNRLILLSYVDNALNTGVRAQVYHNSMLKIGDFDRVTSWMGTSDGTTSFDFDTLSTVMLTQAAATEFGIEPASDTTISNIIGVMYDKYAAGISVDKQDVSMSYTAVTMHYTSFYHNLFQTYVRDDHSIVYFTLN